MAQLGSRCGLCAAPDQRGVRGLGGQPKERSEYVFLDAHALDLCALHGKTRSRPIWPRVPLPRPRSYGEADPRHSALCTPLAGPVALGSTAFLLVFHRKREE